MAEESPTMPAVSQDGVPTLADAFRTVESDSSLSATRRRCVLSNLRRFAVLLGLDLERMPAQLGRYRETLRDFSPVQAGIRPQRWSTIKADVQFAVQRAGLPCLPGHSHIKLTGSWKRLYESLRKDEARMGLGRFMRYCTARGVGPDEVCDDICDEFRKDLIELCFKKDPAQIHRRTLVLWNDAAREVVGWPSTILSVTDNRKRWTLSWDSFPPSLRDEVEEFLAWRSETCSLDDSAPPRALRPSSQTDYRYSIRVLASALVLEGWQPSSLASLKDLVEPETLKKGLQHIKRRSSNGSTHVAYSVAFVIKGIARHWLRVDDAHLEKISVYCRRLDPCQKGMTAKNRERLRQFNDPLNLELLLNFPQDHLQRLRQLDGGKRNDAVKAQIAAAVEILIVAPIRLGNLARLDLGRHLQFSRSARKGVVHLVIPGAEVKNGQDLEFELPPETTQLLKAYIKDYHPRLSDGHNTFLFPGRNGKHKQPDLLNRQISKTLLAGAGIKMNVHLFRHLAAKLYLEENPGGYEVVRRFLGHASMETTVRFYAGTETAAATRHYDQTILGLRRRSRAIPRLERS